MNDVVKIIELIIDNGGNDMLLSKTDDMTRKMCKLSRYKTKQMEERVILEDGIDNRLSEQVDLSNVRDLSISRVFNAIDLKFSNDKYTYQLYIKNVIRNTKSTSDAANDFMKCVFY